MNENSIIMLQKYTKYMEKPSKLWWTIIAISGVTVLFGLYALIIQITEGQVVTGMRDNVVWGIYEVNFILLLGISYSGAIISGIFHLGRIDWGKPLIRIIEITTFVTLLIGPIYILLCIGRLDRLHYLFIYMRIQSPIIWDLIAVILDLILCTTYLYLTFIKDFALLHKNAKDLNLAPWKINLYKKLSIGYTGTENQTNRLNKALDILAAMLIPIAVIAYSLLAWLFGMNLREGWDDSIFAPYFIVSAVLSGMAIIIVLMGMIKKIYKSSDIITDGHFSFMGYGMGIMATIFGYFTFSDFITRTYNSSHANTALIERYMDLDDYGWMTIIMMAFSVFIPIIVVAIPKLRTNNNFIITSVLVLIGLWFFRYLIVITVLETPYLPVLSTDPAVIDYSATWVEWVLTIAGLGAMTILYMIILKVIPIFPIAEMHERHTFKLFGKYSFRDLVSHKDYSNSNK